MSRRMMTRPQVNKSGSLPAGVYCYIKPRVLRSGEQVDYLYFSTHTVEDGRRVVKSFSCGRWPVSKATFKTRKAEAITYRRAWEARVHAEAMGLGGAVMSLDLTRRQLLIARLLVQGLQTGQIAERTGLTAANVSMQKTLMKRRLGVSENAELVRVLKAADLTAEPEPEPAPAPARAIPLAHPAPRKRTLFFRVDRGPAR